MPYFLGNPFSMVFNIWSFYGSIATGYVVYLGCFLVVDKGLQHMTVTHDRILPKLFPTCDHVVHHWGKKRI